MPVNYNSRIQAEQTYQTLMDWVRKLMQLAVVAVGLLTIYLVWGFLSGVSSWSTLDAAARLRIGTNIDGAINYLNIALSVLLVTILVLYYDEEAVGYTFLVTAVALVFGVPLALEYGMPGQLSAWNAPPVNKPALAILRELRLAGMVIAIPGGLLAVRDVVMRLVDGVQRKRDQFDDMEYGSTVKEEQPPATPIIGVLAKCWQLPYCRDAIRPKCPIFLNRTRCWRQRVGCMCEEGVLRQSMDAVIHREEILNPTPEKQEGIEGLTLEGGSMVAKAASASAAQAKPEKTQTIPPARQVNSPSSGKNVRIPHNPHIPMSVKVERCRNCVIYNEHQRMKYQAAAPFVVLGIPGIAIWQVDNITRLLSTVLTRMDKMLSMLSLDAQAQQTGIANSLSSSNQLAQYMIIGCVVVMGTTFALRTLEHVVFKLKW